ncbi:MAG: YkvA family protein [Candidatus Geothermincolia bacterium]
MDRLRRWASRLKTETFAVYLAGRDPRTPWYAKVLAVCVVGYALSPIDLIPDFIPVLGYLDDLIIVPAGLAVAVRLIPATVLAECRERAALEMADKAPVSRAAVAVVIGVWLLLAALAAFLIIKVVR